VLGPRMAALPGGRMVMPPLGKVNELHRHRRHVARLRHLDRPLDRQHVAG
jgi:hypothetical protein